MDTTATPERPGSTSSPPLTEEEEIIDIAQYWRVIKRHKFSIFSITVICLIIGVLVALKATPIYKAETKLIANPLQPNFDGGARNVNTALIFLFYETQYEIIGSRNIAQKIVDKLGLVTRYKEEQIANIKPAKAETDSFIQKIKSLLPGNQKQQPIQELDDEVLRANLATNIQSKVTAKGGKQSEIIRISYEDPNPQRAADITNAIAEAYMEFGLESRLSGAKQISTWLNNQLQYLEANLKKSEDALLTFQKNQGMVDTSQQARLSGIRLSALTTELTQAQTKFSEIDIRYKQIHNKHQKGDYASLNSILDNPIIQMQEQEIINLSRSVQKLSERYGEKHPKMIAARADLNEARQSLKNEIDKVVDGVRKKHQAATDLEKELNTRIKKEKRDLSIIRGSSFELARLEREVANHQKLYESFLVRFQQANVSEQYDVSNIHVIDIARVPVKPYKPNRTRFIIIALALGLFMGGLFAFFREYLDNTFKTTEDLENKLNLPMLGIIPLVKESKNIVTPERQVFSDSRSQFSENVNDIRTGLLFPNIDNPSQTILVTSAVAMEGKSVLATNLASSLSQLGSTLLLEVNLRKPSIAKCLEIKPIPGIADQALSTELVLGKIITKIGDEKNKLYVMPAGRLSPNPLELLSSDYFRSLLKKLRETYTYIVLDGPPALAISDAIVIGQLVDSVIIAVKAKSTKIQMSQEAIKRLQKANVKIAGTVLCQVDIKQMYDYGSNDYHHYDASHYGYRNMAREGAGSIDDREK